MKPILSILSGLLLILFATHAFAQTTTEVDLNPVLTQLSAIVVDIVVGVIGVLALYLAAELKKKWGIDIEAQVRAIEAAHRDTLHSAVQTWADAALAKYGPNLDIKTNSAAIAFILNGIKSSSPEAVKALQASDDWIINKVAGLLNVTPVTVAAIQ